MDLLTKGAGLPERTLVWQLDLMPHIQRHYAKPKPYATEVARRGKWKMLSMDGRPVALFDLEADPLEDVNLVEKKPDAVEPLVKAVRTFLTSERDRRGAVN